MKEILINKTTIWTPLPPKHFCPSSFNSTPKAQDWKEPLNCDVQ